MNFQDTILGFLNPNSRAFETKKMYYSIQIFKMRVLIRNLAIGEKGRPNQVFESGRYFNSKMRVYYIELRSVFIVLWYASSKLHV